MGFTGRSLDTWSFRNLLLRSLIFSKQGKRICFFCQWQHAANWIKSRRRRTGLQRIRFPSMNIDAQASVGHVIRVLHLSVAVFPPIASVSNYQSESDSTQKNRFFHRQRVEGTSIKMPQGSGSTAPRVCDSELAPTNLLWPSRYGSDICHQMCFLCRQALCVCVSRYVQTVLMAWCRVVLCGVMGVQDTHSTSVH